MKFRNINGFSLIELLVVVAIIAVLAGAGIVGYQNYIDGSRNDVIESQVAQTSRQIEAHTVTIEGNLAGPDWLSDPSVAGTCHGYVAEMVNQLNEQFNNLHDADDGEPYFNGHDAPNASTTSEWISGVLPTATPQTPKGYEITVPPGKILVFCADLDAPVHDTIIITCANASVSEVTTNGRWGDGSSLQPTSGVWQDANGDGLVQIEEIPDGQCPHPGST